MNETMLAILGFAAISAQIRFISVWPWQYAATALLL